MCIRDRLIEKISDKTDIKDLTELLATTIIHLEEVITNLQSKISKFEDDPEALAQLDQHMEQLHQLARKHKVSIHQLPAVHQQLQQKSAQLHHGETNMKQLVQEIKAAKAQYNQMAETISQTRHKQQPRLSQEIHSYLQQIGLAETQFKVEITSNPEPKAHGLENISFWISTNPGQPLQPLEQVASGGELSRISLALQMLKAQTSNIPLLVFDEVDVGIGGAIAATVGKMLQTIGKRGQVLCITHQAQVAAYGQHHLLATKKIESGTSQSSFHWLAEDATRIQELARMISGMTMNATTMEHARHLLNST